jgi:glycosyltransferase involved in cell wall biosynthesis
MVDVQGVLERMKIICLIPSFNEEKKIGGLVAAVRSLGYDCCVIDDGSSDRTAALALENGAEVVTNEVNLGKGASLRKAFSLLIPRDYDAVIIMDGDGQHLPRDISQFVACYQEKHPGIIVGNRMQKSRGMPFVRWVTNSFMSFVLSKIAGQDIPDSQCGFRLVDMLVLKALNLYTEKFEIESEMLLEAAKMGFAIKSVPITTVYEGQASAIHPVKDTIRFFKFVIKRK